MTLSRKNPKYQDMDVNKTVYLPQHLQFLVVDERPGYRHYHKAKVVSALGLDSNGEVTHLAFTDDTSSFEPSKNFTAIGLRP